MEPRKQAIIDALAAFINQRGGLDFGNYGDVKAFRAEQRSITKDGKQARTLLDAVKWRDGIDADALLKAARGAYSGRLTITPGCRTLVGPGVQDVTHYAKIDYCAGQYFPTEYRRAVCAVLASALWDYAREHAMPPVHGHRVESWSQLGKGRDYGHVRATRADADKELAEKGGRDYGHVNEVYRDGKECVSAGDWLRAHFAREFGRGIASRWFN
jgi:hypothetical protein